jgi:hypothetical protein
MEVLAIRVDVLQKLLAIFFYTRGRFEAVEPELEDIIDNINILHKMEKLLEENGLSSSYESGGA